MSDLIDSVSAVASVDREIESDKLRWKSLVHSVANGEPSPPARVVERLGTAFDFSPEQSTATFLEDVALLKRHRNLVSQKKKAAKSLKDWEKKFGSRTEVEEELKQVQDKSVELRTALSQHWQKENSVSAKHWQIHKIETSENRIL